MGPAKVKARADQKVPLKPNTERPSVRRCRRRSNNERDPGGPQSLAGPTALLDSAGRSGLLRCASLP
jgi:hypothetical protein